MAEPENPEKQLPQRALKKIRALCKGNGAPADAIQIKSANGEVIQCQALTHIELHPEIKEEKKKGRFEAGEIIEDPSQLQKVIGNYTSSALKNDETRKYLAKILLDRPDKGFAVHAEYFDVPPLQRDYCTHEPCGTCQGNAAITCGRCGGKRQETCNQCHGRTMLGCSFCNGSGFMQSSDGKQIQCNRCFGQRQIACTYCRKTGTITCRQCKGTGGTKCNSCNGSAFFTHIIHVAVKLKTLFEIDRAALPHPAVKVIENQGGKMVAKEHIQIQVEPVKREDGGLALQYDARFPYGDLELSINGKPLKTHIFGFKGKMLKLPPFLDQLVDANFQILKEAANGQGSVTGKIRKASKSRLIGEGILAAVTMPPKKAMLALKKKFPMGASNAFLKDVILTSNKALANVTSKARYGGLGLGAIIMALLNGGYFLASIRETVVGSLPSPAPMIVDFVLIALGGFIGNLIVQKIAQNPLQKALGPLMPAQQRGKFKPKTQTKPWLSYIVSMGVFVLMIFLSKVSGGSVPNWFPF